MIVQKKQNQSEDRIKILAVLAIVSVFLVLWRMFDLEILNNDKYIALAEGQQRFEKIDLAQRGRVYVHDKIEDKDALYPLAFDVKSFAFWVVPKHISNKEETAGLISELIDIPKDEIFDKINNDKLYIPPIKRDIDFDLANTIKEQKIVGVFVMPEYGRYYPEATLASQVLGFVNAEGKGNYGFEGHYDRELQGTAGKIVGEKDTLGRIISLLGQQEDAKDGTSYVLTVDRSVQYFAEKTLDEAIETYSAEGGTVIAMDVKTGGIVAMASAPDFDPNNFREHAEENQNIFINPAIAYTYEPGSVLKPIIMASALDTGVVSPDTKETFSNYTVVSGYEIHTAEDKAYGEETMTQILENSDNVGMVWVSEQLGKENLYKYLNKFNFFDKTNIDLDTEASGYTPPFKHWRDINRASISFGQGISVTPIELICAYATLANNGVYVHPRVVDKIILPNGEEKTVQKSEGNRIVSELTAKQIREMLYSVVENGHGKRGRVEGFKIGGKTGTAEIANPEGGYLEESFNHTYIGMAPIDDPQFVLFVKLDKPKTAEFSATTAAPTFSKIASFLLNYYYRIEAEK